MRWGTLLYLSLPFEVCLQRCLFERLACILTGVTDVSSAYAGMAHCLVSHTGDSAFLALQWPCCYFKLPWMRGSCSGWDYIPVFFLSLGQPCADCSFLFGLFSPQKGTEILFICHTGDPFKSTVWRFSVDSQSCAAVTTILEYFVAPQRNPVACR